MSWVDKIYIAVAFGALLSSGRNWRGALWVLGLTASFFISGAFWRTTGSGELFTFVCDTSLALAMYAFGRYRWEVWLLVTQTCMVITSLLYTAFPELGLETYQIALEGLNAVAFFLIGITGWRAFAGRTDGHAFHHVRHLWGFGFALRRQGAQG